MTEYLFGQVAANIVNFSMAAPKKAVSALDFMPSRPQAAKPKQLSQRALTKKLNRIFRVTHASNHDHRQQGTNGKTEVHE